MKRRKVKALVVALVLTCLSGMTALAASNACDHVYQPIGVSPAGTWNWDHTVPGYGNCKVTRLAYRHYYQCDKCGDQYYEEELQTHHSNPNCDEK